MTQAYRTNGGTAQFVQGGIKGQCLTLGHREYQRGFDDAKGDKAPILNPSTSYQRGYDQCKAQARKFRDQVNFHRICKELGLTPHEFRKLKDMRL